MKTKKNILSAALIINLIIFIGFQIHFFSTSDEHETNIFKNDIVFSAPYTKLMYGDVIKSHVINTVLADSVSIGIRKNVFKVIYIKQQRNLLSYSLDDMIYILEIKKCLANEDVDYYQLIYAKKNYVNPEDLKNLSATLDIAISQIDSHLLHDIYRMDECHCGYLLLLDPKNVVRYVNTPIEIDDFVAIVKNEMKKYYGKKR